MKTVIELENIRKHFDTGEYTVKAVEDVSLSFLDNEAIAIVGPSGSGKSTLLNMIGLIFKPDAGHIKIGGEDVTAYGDSAKSLIRNHSFGYIVQDFALLDDEKVYNNIRIPLLYNRSIHRTEHKERIKAVAESLDISDKLYRKASKLSGGERQRVAIARAIVCDQPIILADEPTGSLDAANRDNVMDILLNLCKERNKLLIIVTHDFSIANRCDRVIQMKDGHVAEASIVSPV